MGKKADTQASLSPSGKDPSMCINVYHVYTPMGSRQTCLGTAFIFIRFIMRKTITTTKSSDRQGQVTLIGKLLPRLADRQYLGEGKFC